MWYVLHIKNGNIANKMMIFLLTMIYFFIFPFISEKVSKVLYNVTGKSNMETSY